MSDHVAARSYRPGEWFGVLGKHAAVVLPPTEKARAAELWSMVDDGAGFEEVLDALIAGGLRALPGFALVSTVDAETRVVLRGEARGHFTTAEETVELDGSTAATWVERVLYGVTAMTLRVGSEGSTGDGHDLPIDAGLVRVSAVSQPPVEPPAVEQPPLEHEPALEEPAQPAAEPAAPWADDPDDDTTSHPALAEEPSAADHDGMTMAGGWDALDVPPGIPGQPPAPSVTRPVARLVFSSGDTLDVDRAVLVGRSPEARRSASDEQPRLVPVPSPQQEISSTHLEVRPGSGADHGTAVVTDLGSTNGTVLVQPGLPPEDLQPGIAVQLIPGAIIDLGDGVTIQVINP